jgi:hypothetical protein
LAFSFFFLLSHSSIFKEKKKKKKKKKMIISRRRRKKKGLKRWNMDNLMEYDVKDNTLDHSLISFSWKPKKGRASLLLNQLPLSLARCISTTTVCTREFTYISSTSTFHLSLSLYFFPPFCIMAMNVAAMRQVLRRSYPDLIRSNLETRALVVAGGWALYNMQVLFFLWAGVFLYSYSFVCVCWIFMML